MKSMTFSLMDPDYELDFHEARVWHGSNLASAAGFPVFNRSASANWSCQGLKQQFTPPEMVSTVCMSLPSHSKAENRKRCLKLSLASFFWIDVDNFADLFHFPVKGPFVMNVYNIGMPRLAIHRLTNVEEQAV